MSARVIDLTQIRAKRRAKLQRQQKRYTPAPVDPNRMARFELRETWTARIADRFPPLPDTMSFIAFCLVAVGYWVILP